MLNNNSQFSAKAKVPGTSVWPVILLMIIAISVAVLLTFKWALRDVSGDVAGAIRFKSRSMQLASQIRDYRGQDIGVFSDETRFVVPLSKIPLHVQNAFLAAEDDGFYSHIGVSPNGVVRALLANFRRERFAQGGSTVTQQLIRQFLLPRDKTISRKIREIAMAVSLERQMSKKEILDIWLNSVYLGNNSWGVETAARHYFKKHIDQLTLAEACLLAGLPQAPSRFAPHLRPRAARQRQIYVLKRLRSLGWIDQDEWSQASNEKTIIEPQRARSIDQAPWVTEAVRMELWRRLEQKNIPKTGLVINTTVDGGWQRSLQEMVASDFSGIRKDGLELSLVVLDTRTGDIRAMIGGSDFSKNQFNRAFDLYRPIGAAIYPIVFGWGIERGLQKIDGYSSLAEAAVKTRFAEAEQIAPEIGYGLVRDKLMGLGFVVKDAMAIDEMHGSPLTLARSYLGIAGASTISPHGLIENVNVKGELLYSSQPGPRNVGPRVSPAVGWVIRHWMSMGARSDSLALSREPLFKSIKGWNAWWVIPRSDVVIAAWIGADAREPRNPKALKDFDGLMDNMLARWINANFPRSNGVGSAPDGISYQVYSNGSGRPPVRVPFVVSDQGVF